MDKKDIKAFLKERYDFTDKQINKKESNITRIAYLDKERILAKETFYMQEFNLTKDEYNKMIKFLPALLGLDIESVKAKETFYMQVFNVNKDELHKMIKLSPALLGYNEDSIKAKISFYMQEFNLTRDKINKIITPALLCLSENTIKAKISFYMQEFNLSKDEINSIISPSWLCLSDENIKNKHKILKELNIPDSIIINDPAILTAPELSLKVRYMILYIVEKSDVFLRKKWYMTSHKKTWARLCWLRTIGKKIMSTRDLLISEQNFFDRYNIDSKTMMDKFPYNNDAIDMINTEYENVSKATDGIELRLD